MFAIAGLGNPGKKYAKTRHNVGVEVVLELARRAGVALESGKGWQEKDGCEFAKTSLDGISVILALPRLYMNRSGEALFPLLSYFKIPPEKLIVIHDELDLDPGVLRLKQGGSAGGHNGLKSLLSILPTADFYRVRVGIGHPRRASGERKFDPGDEDAVSDWVLSAPRGEEALQLSESVSVAADSVMTLLKSGLADAQQKFHTATVKGAGAKPPK